MVKPYFSVFFLAHDETEKIPLTLIELDRYLSRVEYSYEIVAISDGYSKSVTEMLLRFEPLIKNLRVVQINPFTTREAALREGALSARASWHLWIDAKNTVPISELEKILPLLKEGYDIVSSARIRGARVVKMPVMMRIFGSAINWFSRKILRSKISDFLMTFRCFSRDATAEIFSRANLTGSAFLIETMILGERMGFKIKEVPIHYVYAPDPNHSFWAYILAVLSVLKINYRLRKNRYARTSGTASLEKELASDDRSANKKSGD